MLGIGGNLLKFIASYLNKGMQYVKLNVFSCEKLQVTRCVPQGSQHGSLAFIIFVNGLPLHKTNCETFGDADDLKFVATSSESNQYDIKPIEKWCLNNKITKNEMYLANQNLDKYKFSLNNKNFTLQEITKRSVHYNGAKPNWKPNFKKN